MSEPMMRLALVELIEVAKAARDHVTDDKLYDRLTRRIEAAERAAKMERSR